MGAATSNTYRFKKSTFTISDTQKVDISHLGKFTLDRKEWCQDKIDPNYIIEEYKDAPYKVYCLHLVDSRKKKVSVIILMHDLFQKSYLFDRFNNHDCISFLKYYGVFSIYQNDKTHKVRIINFLDGRITPPFSLPSNDIDKTATAKSKISFTTSLTHNDLIMARDLEKKTSIAIIFGKNRSDNNNNDTKTTKSETLLADSNKSDVCIRTVCNKTDSSDIFIRTYDDNCVFARPDPDAPYVLVGNMYRATVVYESDLYTRDFSNVNIVIIRRLMHYLLTIEDNHLCVHNLLKRQFDTKVSLLKKPTSRNKYTHGTVKWLVYDKDKKELGAMVVSNGINKVKRFRVVIHNDDIEVSYA
jgi:hypothetical protein